ncbi:MAG: Hsp70 family protein [Rhodococcus sp. (in: high G+C Gram-positive bacteria)]|uniref:Hsp70 family protein n=1 Tax=Rhodococcus sp. TaxID=1831 RepID=UPI003BAE9236
MSTSLGMSTGAAGVGSALVTTDPRGVESIEYRYLSADQAHTDLGDLVCSSMSLMTTQVPAKPATPDVFAVAYRTPGQAHSIRSAVSKQRHRVHLVPETAAALAYLRHTGEVARHATVGIVDFGESGMSVAVVDQAEGTVLHADRTAGVSGSVIDDLVIDHVVGALPPPHPLRHLDRDLLAARCRVAKEQLSSEQNTRVDIDFPGIRPILISRSTFEEIVAPTIHSAVEFLRTTIADSPRTPDALALIGGGSNIRTFRTAVGHAFDARTIAVSEPDTAAAKGAAFLAASSAIRFYPATESNRPSSAAKVSGAVVGALVVGGLVLGYGVRELTPSIDTDVSPAGTDTAQTTAQVVPDAPAATRIPSDDPTPTSDYHPTPGRGITTSGLPSQPTSASERGSRSETTPTLLTTPPTSAPTVPVGPTLPGTNQPLPDWPHIEWPDVPPLWPQIPGEPLLHPGSPEFGAPEFGAPEFGAPDFDAPESGFLVPPDLPSTVPVPGTLVPAPRELTPETPPDTSLFPDMYSPPVMTTVPVPVS